MPKTWDDVKEEWLINFNTNYIPDINSFLKNKWGHTLQSNPAYLKNFMNCFFNGVYEDYEDLPLFTALNEMIKKIDETFTLHYLLTNYRKHRLFYTYQDYKLFEIINKINYNDVQTEYALKNIINKFKKNGCHLNNKLIIFDLNNEIEEIKEKSPEVRNPHAVCVSAGVEPEKWKKSSEDYLDLFKWEHLNSSKQEYFGLFKNGQWCIEKANKEDQEKGVHTPDVSPFDPGQSVSGRQYWVGRHLQSQPLKQRAIEAHKEKLKELRSMPAPKLPKK